MLQHKNTIKNFDYTTIANRHPTGVPPPRGDAGGLSREYVLRIPSVS